MYDEFSILNKKIHLTFHFLIVSEQTYFLFPGDFNMHDELSIEECSLLLRLARQSLEQAVNGKPLEPLDVDELPSRLKEQGATFVTLTRGGSLRGCIGTLEPYLPLAEDVREHTIAAALRDYRFQPVLSLIHI